MPGQARHDLALKNLGQRFFLCGVIYRRRLVCGFLRRFNGDEGAMSKRWLRETSQVLAWKYFKSERSEKRNLHGSGRTGQTEKKSISSRKKRLHTCTTCFENSEICEETQPSVYPQPLSKVRLPLSPIVMQFWKDEKISLGKKGGREWTGNPRIFLGKCWVGSALYFFEWVGVRSFRATE